MDIIGWGAALVLILGVCLIIDSYVKGHLVSPPPPGMKNVEFDGHAWIISSGGASNWQPVHHPDCHCRLSSSALLPEKP